jgi:AcrR family transcriptional regulator
MSDWSMPKSIGPTSLRTTPQRSRRGGRPTREDTVQLSLDIREAALTQFLKHGYEGTSLDNVASEARTTKASIYVRFSNKESLFTGVMSWAIGRSDGPRSESNSLDLDNLEEALRSVADAALKGATNPSMVRLTQIVIAQADRFPDLAQKILATSSTQKEFIVRLLQHHAADGAIVADEPEILAEHFLGMVSGMPARLASLGFDRSAATQRRYRDVAIELFLRGLRPD